jgi:O-antigen ligase
MSAVTILGLVVAVALGLGLLEALIRRADLGAALILGVMLVQAVLVSSVPAITLAGGIRVLPFDMVFGLVLAAAFARLLRLTRFAPFQRWAVLLTVLLFVSLALGAKAFGVERSVAEFRLYIAFVAAALYVATFPPSDWLCDRIGRMWLAASIAIMILVALRWAQSFAGINLGVSMEEFGADAAVRVINGPYTFFLAHALMLTAPFWVATDHRSRRLMQLGVVLLLFVVLLDRRTVWIALVAGVIVLVLRRRRLRRRVMVMALAATFLTAGLYLAFSGADRGDEKFAQSATSTGNLEWRVEGWVALTSAWSADPVSWVIGQPFGSGFARQIENARETSDPHSFYLLTLLRTGVVGLLALLALTVGLLRRHWSIAAPLRADHVLGVGVFPALLTMQLLWFITWVPGMEQGIITGLAIALAKRPRRRAAPGRTPAGRQSGPPHRDRTEDMAQGQPRWDVGRPLGEPG